MKEIAISVKNLSKVYHIYDKPRHRLYDMISPLMGKIHQKYNRIHHRKFYALKNINFELNKGDSIGFIGKNGAGKSSLLQIIAGTLSPTEGEIQVNGRVNALLELGSGFNPDFTGRENVYMNGAILGFGKDKIDKKFDEILEFSEIGRFIDQPVKTYSSGMFVKLAFSVQALLDPEILIVDEALSVGDIFFQKKCHQIIQKLLGGQTTFIFVSHDMGAIVKYCRKTILLDKGKVLYYGDSVKATSLYFQMDRLSFEEIQKEAIGIDNPLGKADTSKVNANSEIPYLSIENCKIIAGNMDKIKLLGYSLLNSNFKPTNSFTIQDKAILLFKFQVLQDTEAPIISFSITNKQNITVFGKYAYQFKDCNIPKKSLKGEVFEVELKIQLDLYPDDYIVSIGIISMLKNDLVDIEKFSLNTYQDKYKLLLTMQICVFTIKFPNKGLYLPFNGLSDLPSECRYIT